MATGTGKTIVFAEIIRRYLMMDGTGPVLVIAHRAELLDQAKKVIEQISDLECDLEKGASHCSMSSLIVLGSVQTLCHENRLEQFGHDHFGLIIVDEAHHTLAKSYLKVLKWFPKARVLGVTATPYRGDRQDLDIAYDSLAYDYSIARGIDEGYLCDISAQVVPVKIDLNDVALVHGDYAAKQLGGVLAPHIEEAAHIIADICVDRKTVVFLPLVSTAKKMRDTLNDLGLKAREVDGTSKTRSETLAWFDSAGKGSVLCNSMLLTEGWDCPSADCIVVLRVTRSRGLYMQMVGRGTRISRETGKKDLLLLDFLWYTKDLLDIVRPASIFFANPIEAAMAMNVLEKTGKAMNIREAGRAADDTAELRLEEELASLTRGYESYTSTSPYAFSYQFFPMLEQNFQLARNLERDCIGLVEEVSKRLTDPGYRARLDSALNFATNCRLFLGLAVAEAENWITIGTVLNNVERSVDMLRGVAYKLSTNAFQARESDIEPIASVADYAQSLCELIEELLALIEKRSQSGRKKMARSKRTARQYSLYDPEGRLVTKKKMSQILKDKRINDFEVEGDRVVIRALDQHHYFAIDKRNTCRGIIGDEKIEEVWGLENIILDHPYCRIIDETTNRDSSNKLDGMRTQPGLNDERSLSDRRGFNRKIRRQNEKPASSKKDQLDGRYVRYLELAAEKLVSEKAQSQLARRIEKLMVDQPHVLGQYAQLYMQGASHGRPSHEGLDIPASVTDERSATALFRRFRSGTLSEDEIQDAAEFAVRVVQNHDGIASSFGQKQGHRLDHEEEFAADRNLEAKRWAEFRSDITSPTVAETLSILRSADAEYALRRALLLYTTEQEYLLQESSLYHGLLQRRLENKYHLSAFSHRWTNPQEEKTKASALDLMLINLPSDDGLALVLGTILDKAPKRPLKRLLDE